MQSAVDSGQIRRFTGNDYAQPLAKGDLAAAIALVGRHLPAALVEPEAPVGGSRTKGGMIWTDNMMIPTGGSAATASTYMNFVYDPKIAAQIAAYVAYVPPVKGTQEAMREDRSGAGEEPARVPDGRDARQGAPVRLGRPQQRDVHRAVAEGPRGMRSARA